MPDECIKEHELHPTPNGTEISHVGNAHPTESGPLAIYKRLFQCHSTLPPRSLSYLPKATD